MHAYQFSTLEYLGGRGRRINTSLGYKTRPCLKKEHTHTAQSCVWCPRPVVQHLGGLKRAWTGVWYYLNPSFENKPARLGPVEHTFNPSFKRQRLSCLLSSRQARAKVRKVLSIYQKTNLLEQNHHLAQLTCHCESHWNWILQPGVTCLPGLLKLVYGNRKTFSYLNFLNFIWKLVRKY